MRPADTYRAARRNAERNERPHAHAIKAGRAAVRSAPKAVRYPQTREAARRLRQRQAA